MGPRGIRVVAVEPLYQINLGYIARVAKNFGISDLALVNPRCKVLGKNALKYSKHGSDLLYNAKVYKSLSGAIGSRFAIGTTAIWHKTDKSFYNVYALDKAADIVWRNRITNFCVVVGRESTGLSKDELRRCNMSAIIQTPNAYGTLNLSHALSVILYELTKRATKAPMENIYASGRDIASLNMLFGNLVRKHGNIRDRDGVIRGFRNVIMRANPTRKEANAIAIALSDKGIAKKDKKRSDD